MLDVEALPTIEEDEFDLDVQLLPAIASRLDSRIIAGSGNTCNTAAQCSTCGVTCPNTCQSFCTDTCGDTCPITCFATCATCACE
jgi:hypothetical protein